MRKRLEGAVSFAVKANPFFILRRSKRGVTDAIQLDVVVTRIIGPEARRDFDEDMVISSDTIPREAGVGRTLVNTFDLDDEVVVAGGVGLRVRLVSVLTHFEEHTSVTTGHDFLKVSRTFGDEFDESETHQLKFVKNFKRRRWDNVLGTVRHFLFCFFRCCILYFEKIFVFCLKRHFFFLNNMERETFIVSKNFKINFFFFKQPPLIFC